MKVGLLTMTFNNNYGGVLQAYSLYKTIQNTGNDPILINCKLVERNYCKLPFIILKRLIYKFVLRKKNIYIIPEEFLIKENSIIESHFNRFIESNFTSITKPIYNDNDFLNVVNRNICDAYVVGSDQVWRPKMYKFFKHAFFDFVKDKNKPLIAYAPSFGVDTWEISNDEVIKIRDEIKYFKAVSVREKSGIDLCNKYFNVNAELVLDPTLLIDAKDYYDNFITENLLIQDFIAEYFLDPNVEKFKIRDELCDTLKMESKQINNTIYKNREYDLSDRIVPSIESWIENIYYSKFVITDSYHGVIFSIIFNRNFIVIGNHERGLARILSLLETLNIENRIIYDNAQVDFSILKEEINWNIVNEKLKILKASSLEFIKNSLK